MGCSIVLLQCRIHTPSKPRTGPFRERIAHASARYPRQLQVVMMQRKRTGARSLALGCVAGAASGGPVLLRLAPAGSREGAGSYCDVQAASECREL